MNPNQVHQNKLKTVYVCTKLALITTDYKHSNNLECYSAACAKLNTGEEKYFFLTEQQAQALLRKNGTFWCVYTLNIPAEKVSLTPTDTQLIIDKNYKFQQQDITDIQFHSTFGSCLMAKKR